MPDSSGSGMAPMVRMANGTQRHKTVEAATAMDRCMIRLWSAPMPRQAPTQKQKMGRQHQHQVKSKTQIQLILNNSNRSRIFIGSIDKQRPKLSQQTKKRITGSIYTAKQLQKAIRNLQSIEYLYNLLLEITESKQTTARRLSSTCSFLKSVSSSLLKKDILQQLASPSIRTSSISIQEPEHHQSELDALS